MEAPIRIRTMRAEDLAFADSLRAQAGWNQTMADWRRLLALGGDGCFVAEWDGVPAGVVTTTLYSQALAWIGMALVHSEFQRRGIGRALLENAIAFLRNCRVRRIKLDATPLGRSTYLKLGFRDEWTMTRWEGLGADMGDLAGAAGLRPVEHEDLEAIACLDARGLGASGVLRRELLRSILHDGARGVMRVEAGRVTGFGLMREGVRASYLGPLVAESFESACFIASGAIGSSIGKRVYWDIPDASLISEWAARQGFAPQRKLSRMVWGNASENALGVIEQIFGIGGPETG